VITIHQHPIKVFCEDIWKTPKCFTALFILFYIRDGKSALNILYGDAFLTHYINIIQVIEDESTCDSTEISKDITDNIDILQGRRIIE
jgi:hypothetical protein